MKTPWQQHVADWKGCTRCDLSECRTKVVLAKGVIPCEVLFVGEGPGSSEDVFGKPFMGPAGKLLEQIIGEAGFNVTDHDMLPVRVAFTNLIACIPLVDGDKVSEPPRESIEACAPRLREFVALCNPSLIVCVGSLADKWVPKLLKEGHGKGERVDVRSAGKVTRPTTQQSLSRAVRLGQRALADRNARDDRANQPTQARYVSIVHPAAILRADITQRGLAIQKCIVTLSDALAELYLPEARSKR